MAPFRGNDEQLDREIATLEGIARVRVRRASGELRDLDRDLRDLKRERARRRAQVATRIETAEPAPTEATP